ncbi:RNA polymerase sigma factor [Moorella sp. Hama-1]|uniref:RNA polymerase sigma factor n=1 Tax=Moorella sp. Hama-1 TaxID=2138101 RepID=UPI002106E849|nr:sigma-70 family RNA polymerase sigma factor [Moorella sp. Hama-1]
MVELFSPFLLAIIMPIVCNPVTAEDILQETFIQVYRSLPRYRGGSFKHWLARIATNKAIDWKRKRRQSLETMVEYPEQVGGPGLNPGSSVEDEVIHKETLANLLSLC